MAFLQGGSCLCCPVHGAALHGDRCTAGCDSDMNFADESICLLADTVRNEVLLDSFVH
jgi:hypothetical protein